MSRTRRALVVGGCIAAAVVAMLGRGYWHAATHAVLHVSIDDLALKTERQAWGHVRDADITFHDAAGTVLATGRLEDGVLAIPHPTAGDCRREERAASASRDGMAAWNRCFDTKSRWLATWATRVSSASLRVADCRIERAPVALEASRDAWWLWWIPTPHVGGLSPTYVTATLRVDGRACGGR